MAGKSLKLFLIALFLAGAATSYLSGEARLKAAGALFWVGIPTALLWVDIGRWIWLKRVGPLVRLGTIHKAESKLAYRGLIFLYIVLALIASCITYGIAGYALVGTLSLNVENWAFRDLRPNRWFDTDAQRRAFASLRSSPPVAGQLRRYPS
jgi:membrane protease YdiL (CAAX protease family)